MKKRCTDCNLYKGVEEFYKNKAKKDGLADQCKSCCKPRREKWQKENHAKYLSYLQKWREENLPKSERLKKTPEELRQLKKIRDKRRRTNKQDAFVEDVQRQVLFERDVGLCQICQDPINNKEEIFNWISCLSKMEPQRPSEDHIVPLSKGGQHSYENVQLTHLECNLKKGALLFS